MISFDKIVNKLGKYKHNIISISDIGNIIDPDFSSFPKKHSREIYKMIYRLKSTNLIVPIKNGLYFVTLGDDIDLDDALDDLYWDIAKKIIRKETGNDYLIGGNKALELHLKDFSIPNKLIVYSKNIQKKEYLGNGHYIQFKIVAHGKNKKHQFGTQIDMSKAIKIQDNNLRVAGIEHSILDALIIHDSVDRIDINLVKKFIAKFENKFLRESFGILISSKYISGANRLREISKSEGFEKTYSMILETIKNEGSSCFLKLNSL